MSFAFPGNYWPTNYWQPNYWPVSGEEEPPPDPEPQPVTDVGFVNGLFSLILVANAGGTIIGELAADIESVSWKLNNVGQAKLVLANPGTAAELIQLGNRLLIYFDNGLQPWTGFIDPPRRWRYGSVSLTAYSGELLVSHRITGRDRYFNKATAGGILAALFNEQTQPAVVEPGYIWVGGGAYTKEYHLRNLLDIAADDLLRLENHDWDVTGTVENGRLVLRANFYERKGRDLNNVWLLEGHNLAGVEPEEQGQIINEWFTAGAGTGWGDADRIYGYARDDVSMARYGLRQSSEIITDVTDQETLDAWTNKNLQGSAYPYVAIPFNALNLAPARFADYDIGDGVNIELYSFLDGGFSGMVRVIGRDFQPRAGGCAVVVV